MDVIICLDDKNGMIFNHRRQSRDRAVIADILNCLNGKRLLINNFSESLFKNTEENITIEGNPLAKATEEDVCFIENFALLPYIERIDRLIVYRWNRIYPADRYLDISLDCNWKMISTTEISGYSHEKITKEIYTR